MVDKMIGTKELSEMIGTPVETLRYWRFNNEGPASFKLGRRTVYSLADVEAWVAERRRNTSRGTLAGVVGIGDDTP